MDERKTTQTASDCSPVFSIAGVMPGAAEMPWTTAYPNPDAETAPRRPAGHGPSFSVAGVMPGVAETTWRTAMPDPTRDVLDTHGHVITKVESATRAELASRPAALPVQAPSTTLAKPAA